MDSSDGFFSNEMLANAMLHLCFCVLAVIMADTFIRLRRLIALAARRKNQGVWISPCVVFLSGFLLVKPLCVTAFASVLLIVMTTEDSDNEKQRPRGLDIEKSDHREGTHITF